MVPQSGTAAAGSTSERASSAGETLRIGIVPYLNVQPLIWSLNRPDFPVPASEPQIQIVPQEPRRLADALSRGAFDTAIVPIFEYLRNPVYSIVPGAAIGCRGPVASVVLFSDTPLEKLKTVVLDPASLTSVNLTRVLLAELRIQVEFTEPADRQIPFPLPKGVGRLVIGDPALARRGIHAFEYDLGALWMELTGLPFVFAAWLVSPGSPESLVARTLQEAAAEGVKNYPLVAAETAARFGSTPEAALRYFRENMHYPLDEPELAGIREYARLCAKHGRISALPEFRLAG